MSSRFTAATYRVSQFIRGFDAHVTDKEIADAVACLPPGGITLFLLMPVDAQRHSLNVLTTLRTEGATSDELAAAALLHDVGKVAAEGQITLWSRGPLVLLDALAPALLSRLAAPTHGWRYALWVQREHPAIGAAWAQQVECSALTCRLIERHQEALPPLSSADDQETRLLRLLQAADNRN